MQPDTSRRSRTTRTELFVSVPYNPTPSCPRPGPYLVKRDMACFQVASVPSAAAGFEEEAHVVDVVVFVRLDGLATVGGVSGHTAAFGGVRALLVSVRSFSRIKSSPSRSRLPPRFALIGVTTGAMFARRGGDELRWGGAGGEQRVG